MRQGHRTAGHTGPVKLCKIEKTSSQSAAALKCSILIYCVEATGSHRKGLWIFFIATRYIMGCGASLPVVVCSGAVSNPKDGALGSVIAAVPSFDRKKRIVTLQHASHGILIKKKRIPWRVDIPTGLMPGQKVKIVLVQEGHNRVAHVQQFIHSGSDGCNDPECEHHNPSNPTPEPNFFSSL